MRLNDDLDSRQTAGNLMVFVGVLLLMAGVWLLFNPTVSELGSETVNLQKLYLGQTAALVGVVLFGVGTILKLTR